MSGGEGGDPPEEAGDNVTFLDMHKPTGKRKPKGGGGKGGGGDDGGDGEKPKRRRIPVLPALDIRVSDLKMAGDVTSLDAAVVAMRIDGAPFAKIAEVLDLPNAGEAKQRMYRAIARTHPQEDWETLRMLETARVDQLLEQSMAMAKADYFVDADDPDHLIPNEDKLRWHGQAAADIALHATITGAKAPTRIEITPSDQEYAILVQKMLEIEGKTPPKEYDILEVQEIPDDPEPEE